MRWLLMPMAVAAGSLMVIQAACNSALERAWDRPLTVAVISLSIGISVLVVIGFALCQLGVPSGKADTSTLVGLAWRCMRGHRVVIATLSRASPGCRHLRRPLRNGLFHRVCSRRSFCVARLR